MEWHISPGPTFAQVSITWNSPSGDPEQNFLFGPPLHDAPSIESVMRHAQIAVFLDRGGGDQIFEYTESFIFELHTSLAKYNTYSPHIIHVEYNHPDVPFQATVVDTPGMSSFVTK